MRGSIEESTGLSAIAERQALATAEGVFIKTAFTEDALIGAGEWDKWVLSAEGISDKGFLISYLLSLRTKPADGPLSSGASDGKLLSAAKSAPGTRLD